MKSSGGFSEVEILVSAEDDMLLRPSLHDATLVEVDYSEGVGLSLRFDEYGSRQVRLLASGRSMFWGAGVAMPVIVSTAWISPGPVTAEWIVSRIDSASAARLVEAVRIYSRERRLLLIETNYGDTIAVFGWSGDGLTAEVNEADGE